MIRKTHPETNSKKNSEITDVKVTKPTKISSQEKQNFIELGRNSVYVFATLFLVTTFFCGYFLGKTKGGITSNSQQNNPTQQVQPQQQQQPQAQQPVPAQISLDTIKGLFSKNVVKFGKGDKKLLMVEVSDPSCPFCHIAGGANNEIGAQVGARFTPVAKGGTYVPPVPEMKKLIDQGKADFVWIYTRGHGNGELATKALYCAYDQNKFWQAHDLLMSAKGYDFLNNQIRTDVTKTKEMADFLASAVDSKSLKSCLDSGKYNSRLQEDSNLATSLGIDGTPGFYLNETNFSGAYSWNDMKSAADNALNK